MKMEINLTRRELAKIIRNKFGENNKKVEVSFTPYNGTKGYYEEPCTFLEITVKITEKILGKDKKIVLTLTSEELEEICKEAFQKEGSIIRHFDLNVGSQQEGFYEEEKAYFDGATIQIEKEKKNILIENLQIFTQALIVVDMVNGFVTEGILHDKRILEIVPRQKELIEEYKSKNQLIIFIKDCHDLNAVEFKRFGNIPHALMDSQESEIIDALKSYENEKNVVSIMKNSTSFMEAPDFRKILELLTNLKRVDLAGCCTDICVCNGGIGMANYFDQYNRNVEIYAHQDAIAAFNEQNRQNYVDAAYLLMAQQGIKLVRKR